MSLGPLEIILLLVVVALIFGARKLPELGKGLGQGIREFKKETKDGTDRPHAAVTDVPSRQLDPVTGAPMPEVHTTPVSDRRS
ncbi:MULTISPECIES: twin-arginine translocase TatA/TatE family subunit [Deinococcus]|uniref:Sec-independent protein translocase protein TatA n=1 Tax=Deinococcus rufus TaxID=2136097 RepID=A0ABV7ZAF0_9DEIO|nr:twin-arginine translocase TatA/TatE family subunit [Deinococcus sp. AB2017081]WQE94605.1 twin-arginine translocase TatA/TatE family subunit [Deinococcus sp. AB2017081]